MSHSDKVPLSEKFVSIQGEGPFVGVVSLFLRVMGCNLRCVWCDAYYTWDREGVSIYNDGKIDKGFPYTFDEFREDCKNYPLTVITGGEPLIYSRIWERWIRYVEYGKFQFETNGTYPPILEDDGRVFFVVSPKLRSSGNKESPNVDVLKEFLPLVKSGRAYFKFVISDPERDEDEIVNLLEDLGFPNELKPYSVFLMPEGITKDLPMAEKVVEMCIRNGFRYSDRIHIRIWGNIRGK